MTDQHRYVLLDSSANYVEAKTAFENAIVAAPGRTLWLGNVERAKKGHELWVERWPGCARGVPQDDHAAAGACECDRCEPVAARNRDVGCLDRRTTYHPRYLVGGMPGEGCTDRSIAGLLEESKQRARVEACEATYSDEDAAVAAAARHFDQDEPEVFVLIAKP